jgi:uncharacterized membrane protein YphA (DoxX/SURF4 family)
VTAEALTFCRAVIGLTFAISAFGKMRDLDAFVDGMRSFEILSPRWHRPVAWAVLAAELVVVVTQLLGYGAIFTGLVLALALLAAYTAVLGFALARRPEVRCNCFGPANRAVSTMDLVRNGLLAAVAVGGLVALSARPPDQSLADVALVVFAAASAVLVLANLDNIVSVVRTPLDPND